MSKSVELYPTMKTEQIMETRPGDVFPDGISLIGIYTAGLHTRVLADDG